MINTKELKDKDKVIVTLDDNEGNFTRKAKCRYSQGIFVNIELSHHQGEIYGSSVISFKKTR